MTDETENLTALIGTPGLLFCPHQPGNCFDQLACPLVRHRGVFSFILWSENTGITTVGDAEKREPELWTSTGFILVRQHPADSSVNCQQDAGVPINL